MPTSKGQEPGSADVMTCLSGTLRVSSCTHVMGMVIFPSDRCRYSAGWTRVTELPDSNVAVTGSPSSLTTLSGAPDGRELCITQPASHGGHGLVMGRGRCWRVHWSTGTLCASPSGIHPPGWASHSI